MTTVAILAGVFALGFLLGENRAVKQANAILDHNTKVLLGAIHEEPIVPQADDEPLRATFH